jgi:CheY-like chemotaxis protein
LSNAAFSVIKNDNWRDLSAALRVLVVDDSETTRRILRVLLGSRDWTICGEAKSGESGVEKFEELKPDVVVLDLAMPDLADPRVLAVKRQAWQKQTSITGAYAFYRPGQWFTIRGALQNRHFKVHFAGEHIAAEQGFMEGAAVTGIEAAKSL